MTTELSTTLATTLARIASESDTTVLITEMQTCLTLSVETLVRLGAIILRLETLGVDVLSFEIPNMDYFRRIAHGQMVPELFLEMGGAPRLLRKVSALPLPDQKEIANGGRLKVTIHGGDYLLIAPKDMTGQQVNQVFGHGGIRTDAQQVAWMADQKQKSANKTTPKPDVELDRKHRGIRVGDVFIGVVDLAGYLAQLAAK